MATRATPRRGHWLTGLLLTVGIVLVPWTAVLGATLPSEHLAQRWDVAWIGFDLLLSMSLLATAVATARRLPWLPGIASVSGTLLLCDAWFDTVTASGDEVWTAAALALFGEVPLAAICFALAVRAAGPLRDR